MWPWEHLAVGYLSHLPGDVFFPVLLGGDPSYEVLFWPVVPTASVESGVGLVAMARRLFGRYVAELAIGDLTAYVAVELGLLTSVTALWLADGAPPLPSVRAWVHLVRRSEETH